MKRGQITVFIIVGVAALIALLLVFFIKANFLKTTFEETKQKLVQKPQEIETLNNEIKNCVDSIAEETLYTIGQQGGYANLENNTLYDKINLAPYYFYAGTKKVISIERLENEISSLLESSLYPCRIEKKGFDISYGDIFIDINIGKKIIFDAEWDVQVKKDEIGFKLDKIHFSKEINLLNILAASNEIVNSLIRYPEGVCVSCISDIVAKYDIKTETFFNEKDLLIKIIDENSLLAKEPNVFIFSNRFKGSLT